MQVHPSQEVHTKCQGFLYSGNEEKVFCHKYCRNFKARLRNLKLREGICQTFLVFHARKPCKSFKLRGALDIIMREIYIGKYFIFNLSQACRSMYIIVHDLPSPVSIVRALTNRKHSKLILRSFCRINSYFRHSLLSKLFKSLILIKITKKVL